METRFRKYDHVERFGHPEVEHLDAGVVHVFPKLDGTHASVWLEPRQDKELAQPHGNIPHLRAGSRNRVLTLDSDNAGFYAWTQEEERLFKLIDFILKFGSHAHVYGEWLVPHTLKTYREEAWRRFYVFDVFIQGRGYVQFEEWAPHAEDFGIDHVALLCTITNPTEDQLLHQVETNTYLVADGSGVGEGIVCKNFEWRNRFGRQPWMKIVRNEFKERSKKAFGTPDLKGGFEVEAAVAEEFVTPTLVAKCRAKIMLDLANEDPECETTADILINREWQEKWRKQLIPRLLQTVYTELVREELYTAVKKHKDPTINFKRLRAQCIRFTKEYAADLF